MVVAISCDDIATTINIVSQLRFARASEGDTRNKNQTLISSAINPTRPSAIIADDRWFFSSFELVPSWMNVLIVARTESSWPSSDARASRRFDFASGWIS